MGVGGDSNTTAAATPDLPQLQATLASTKLRKASELYFPHPEIVSLGFEVLAWPKADSEEPSDPSDAAVSDDGAQQRVPGRPLRGAAAKRAQKKRHKESSSEFLPTSKQAQLLFKIGLKMTPSIHALVKLAAGPSSSSSALPFTVDDTRDGAGGEKGAVRDAVLSYLEKHAAELIKAEPSFTITNLTVPFLPSTLPVGSAYARSLRRKTPSPAAIAPAPIVPRGHNRKNRPQPQAQPPAPAAVAPTDGNKDILAKLIGGSSAAAGATELVGVLCQPKECFLNDSPFGFPVVVPRWRDLAQRLGVAPHPPLSFILDMVRCTTLRAQCEPVHRRVRTQSLTHT
jgi:hypothetical protein